MPQLTPIELEDGTIIYIESTDTPSVTTSATEAEDSESPEQTRSAKGIIQDSLSEIKSLRNRQTSNVQGQMVQNFQIIENTIRAYTTYSLNAFKKLAIANVDKVTLEFGIEIGGEGGIPYVTKGTAKSNLKITVECSFPEKNQNPNP